MPLSDVVVLFEYPTSQATGTTPIQPEGTAATYGWHSWNEVNPDCDSTCKQNIMTNFADEFNNIGGTNHERLLYKIVKKENFVDSFNIFVPLKLTGNELKNLKDGNIPLKIYTFRLFTMYTYFIEGKDYINVYPINVKG